MAQSPRTLPANYPQPLAAQVLKADSHRQTSMLRQEFITDLLSLMADLREPAIRSRLVKMIESNLKTGLAAAAKAEEMWPSLDEATEMVANKPEIKPAAAKKHLKLFAQFDKVHRRSLDLLNGSFANVEVILKRLQPAAPSAKPIAASPGQALKKPGA
jgi:hypothetical protein